MNENYTKGVQRILSFAKEQALKLSHTYVGSEHLLMGIIIDDTGNAASTLKTLGCNLNEMKKKIISFHLQFFKRQLKKLI